MSAVIEIKFHLFHFLINFLFEKGTANFYEQRDSFLESKKTGRIFYC